jgi:hypothetical protein
MLEPIPFAGMVEIDQPVAWMDKDSGVVCKEVYGTIYNNLIPLYTHPAEHDLGIAEAIGFEKGYQAGLRKAQEK